MALGRGKELCLVVGEEAPLFPVLMGTFVWRLVRNEFDYAFDVANEMLGLATAIDDPGAEMEAQFALGSVKFYRGELEEARAHYERGMSLHDVQRCAFYAQFSGQDCGVVTLCYWALTLWHLGDSHGAREKAQQAVNLAQEIKQPFSLAFAFYHQGWVKRLCGLSAEVIDAGHRGCELANEQGFAIWSALSLLNIGAGELLSENPGDSEREAALQKVRDGLNNFRATGANLHISYCFGLLARALTQLGRYDEALEEVDNGLSTVEQFNERFIEPELLRLRGDILLAKSAETSEVEEHYRKSLDAARQCHAVAWQVRTTVSLAKLLSETDRRDAAVQALNDLLSSLPAGTTSEEVADARGLLDSLAAT